VAQQEKAKRDALVAQLQENKERDAKAAKLERAERDEAIAAEEAARKAARKAARTTKKPGSAAKALDGGNNNLTDHWIRIETEVTAEETIVLTCQDGHAMTVTKDELHILRGNITNGRKKRYEAGRDRRLPCGMIAFCTCAKKKGGECGSPIIAGGRRNPTLSELEAMG
jgi:hypothetical protein